MKVKFCVISSASEEIFDKFIDGCEFIPSHWEIHILRNKPLENNSIKKVEKLSNLTLHWRDNSEYVVPNLRYGIKMVKLRYDSVMVTNPKEGEWFLLGDDDMFFNEEYVETAKNTEKLLESNLIDFMVGTNTSSCSYSFSLAKREGIRHGQFFRFNTEVFNEYAKYKELFGGGEDSLFATLNYLNVRCINNIIIGVDHIGHNLANYIPKPWEENPQIYVASVVNGIQLPARVVREINGKHTDTYTVCKNNKLLCCPPMIYFDPKKYSKDEQKDYIIRGNRINKCGFDGKLNENNCCYYGQLNPYVNTCKWLGYGKICVFCK